MQKILVDANVLFSRTQRDWLLLLKQEAGPGMFSLCVTEDILAELEYRLRRKFPKADGAVIKSVREKIELTVDEVLADFVGDVPNPTSDPDDSHVNAAAISADVNILLTADSGFTALSDEIKESLPYEIMEPDDFFSLIDDSAPQFVKGVTLKQLAYWDSLNEDLGAKKYASLEAALVASNCKKFASKVKIHTMRLAGVPNI